MKRNIAIVLLSIAVIGLGGYVVYDIFFASKQETVKEEQKNEQDVNKTEENDSIVEKTTNEIKSYLLFENDKMVDNTHGIKIEQKMLKEPDLSLFINYNNDKIYSEDFGFESSLAKAFLIDNTLLLIIDNDGVKTIKIIDLKGNKIFEQKEFDSLTINPNDSIIVEDDEIFFSASNYGAGHCSNIQMGDNKLLQATYRIKYLGNDKFSNVEKISSMTSDYVC